MPKSKFDFSGYATKNDLKCSDGRTIKQDAFKEDNGTIVPLVWQHIHKEPSNVLGHALLENRADGVYAYCSFNDTEAGQKCKVLVAHGDIKNLSIYANELKQKGLDVFHGAIKEVSLVMAGANPGALIDNLSIQHGDGFESVDDEAVIYTDELITTDVIEHAEPTADKTVEDVFNTLNEEQKTVVYAMLSDALETPPTPPVKDPVKDVIAHSNEGGKQMKINVFDKKDDEGAKKNTLTHDQFSAILADAQKTGSLRDSILAHATEYGIDAIDVLFPDAKALSQDPNWLKREDTWVQSVLNAIHKSPFSRIKSVIADMDITTARAKGYVKATEKKEVYFKASKRITTPTTIYVKQKLDRDDIIDVVDFDIVAMVRLELRTLLNEELAMAALFGDGRPVDDQYKIILSKLQ